MSQTGTTSTVRVHLQRADPLMDETEDAAKARVKAAGERAKAEAAARRAVTEKQTTKAPKEIDGRGGLDPVRYEDWEIKGLTSDF